MNNETVDVLSIAGYNINKNPSHGARHGPSVRQTVYFKEHDMLRKSRNKKSGDCVKLYWKEGLKTTKH